MVQDQLHLCQRQGFSRAYQRGRNRRRGAVCRVVAGYGAAARLHRQPRGAGAVLAQRACPVRQRTARPRRGRAFWFRNRTRRAQLSACQRSDRGRCRGARDVADAVPRLGAAAKRPRRYRVAGAGFTAGRCRAGGPAGAILAAAGGRQLHRAVPRGGGRTVRCRHHPRRAGVPDAVRAECRRHRGAHNVEQAQGGRLGSRQ